MNGLDKHASRALVKLLAEQFSEAGLGAWTADDFKTESPRPAKSLAAPDLVIHTPGNHKSLVVEFKSSARVAGVTQAAQQAKHLAESLNAIPVVTVPFMGESGARAIDQMGVSYIDMSGNAKLRGDGYFIHVTGRPNRYPERGRPSSPFSPASSRVARALLQQPDRWWLRVELTDATRLASGQVSKVVARLLDEGLVEERDDRSLRPSDPNSLLDAWAAEYDIQRGARIQLGHVTGNGIALAHELNARLREKHIDHAFTGLPAAWLYDNFTAFRLITLFVDDLDGAVGATRMRPEPRGANVQLISPRDEGVYYEAREIDGLRCVSPVQTYLDLLGLPERSDEAAAHLREHVLAWNGASK